MAYEKPTKFLLASNARSGSISYLQIPASGKFSGEKMRVLIPGGGALVHPQGLAVDTHRKRLLLADPNLRKIIAYPLVVSGGQWSPTSLVAGKMVTVAEDVEARWVAVDGRGNVYYSNEASNSILKIPADDGRPEVVYTGGDVSGPGGVDTDNFNLFWSNKVNGKEVGSLVSAPVVPHNAQGPRVLSSNIDKSYGVCSALDQVYYTADSSSVYGVSRSGGIPTTIANSFGNPRGCAWDGDSTVYVADRGKGGIFYFSGPQAAMREEEVQKAADLDNAFGVAVFSSAYTFATAHVLIISLLLTCGLLPLV